MLYNSPIDKQEVTLMICGLQYLQDTRRLWRRRNKGANGSRKESNSGRGSKEALGIATGVSMTVIL